MIVFDDKEKIFLLHTKNSTYAFALFKDAFLIHLYWGKRIENFGRIENILFYCGRAFSTANYAFTNNIWISTEGESNSTNISEISYNGSNITVSELPTGIRYLSDSGNMVLNNLTIVADGEVSTAIEDDILTISVTAEDGTVKTTELYMIGDITVIEALIKIPDFLIVRDFNILRFNILSEKRKVSVFLVK